MDKIKKAWADFYAFANSHRRLMLGIVCFIAGYAVGKLT